MGELRERVHIWLRAVQTDEEVRWNTALAEGRVSTPWRANRTKDYVDLIFAFGAVRIGAKEESRRLRRGAESLADAESVHQFLFSAFSGRIEEAEAGRPHAGPLPDSLALRVEGMDPLSRYIVDRFRRDSRIVEPDARVNPYRNWSALIRPFEERVLSLVDQTTPEAFRREADRLLTSIDGRSSDRRERIEFAVLQNCSLARPGQVRSAIHDALSMKARDDDFGRIPVDSFLNAALVAASRLGFKDEIVSLTDRIRCWASQTGARHSSHPLLIRSSVAAFVVIDDPDRADQFLNEISCAILGDETPTEWAERVSPSDAHKARQLLAVASGWYRFGWDCLADPVIRGSLAILKSLGEQPRESAHLPVALALEISQTLRSASRLVAEGHLRALLESVPRFPETHTTGTHFHATALEFVESLCLTAVEVCSNS
jgi:hypothetical protein